MVEIEGRELPLFDGRPLSALRLMALGPGGGLVPVPFQVDERHPDGRWVMTEGLEAGHDVDRGLLDGNDVLVFMLRDGGERWIAADPDPHLEIEVVEPSTGRVRWLYLVEAGDGAPRSPRRYVRARPDTDSIDGTSYELTFQPSLPISWAYLALKDDRGRLVTRNVVDRQKVRVHARVLGMIRWSITEEDVDAEVVGWIDGPVRVVRRLESRVSLGPGIQGPSIEMDTLYHGHWIRLPITVLLPMDGLLSEMVMRLYIDFRHITGWRMIAPFLDEPVDIDGEPSLEELELDRDPASWVMAEGDAGTVLARIRTPVSTPGVQSFVHFVDDHLLDDPPEGDPGQGPSVGFTLLHWDAVEAGLHHLETDIHYLWGRGIRDRDAILTAIESPPPARVRVVR